MLLILTRMVIIASGTFGNDLHVCMLTYSYISCSYAYIHRPIPILIYSCKWEILAAIKVFS